MFGFCKIDEKTGFIWICKRLFQFDFEQRKIINQHDFEDFIIGKILDHFLGEDFFDLALGK